MSFVNLHCRSHYSLQLGLNKVAAIAERTVKLGYKSAALTDYGTVSGVVPFLKAMKDVCVCGKQKGEHENGKGRCRVNNGCEEYRKNSIKPIIGSEFYISAKQSQIRDAENANLSTLGVLAQNKEGWKSLISLTSKANDPMNFYKKPRLDVGKFTGYKGLIAFSGHLGSNLANVIFSNPQLAYEARTYEDAKSLVDPNWIANATQLIGLHQDIFGKENFYLSIETLNKSNLPATLILAEAMRFLAKKTGAQCVASANSHYAEKEDAIDQRVILCNYLDTTLSKAKDKLVGQNVHLARFFKSNNYHIPELQELKEVFTDGEILETVKIAEKCEEFNIFNNPTLPKFNCPNNMTPDEYLRQLVIKGWKETIEKNIPKERHKEYGDRIKKELDVFKASDGFLATYFLIVQDFCNHAKKKLGCLMSPGRGSAAGCMVASLVGVTDKVVDPIKYDLLFERFFGSGRWTPDVVNFEECPFQKFGV